MCAYNVNFRICDWYEWEYTQWIRLGWDRRKIRLFNFYSLIFPSGITGDFESFNQINFSGFSFLQFKVGEKEKLFLKENYVSSCSCYIWKFYITFFLKIYFLFFLVISRQIEKLFIWILWYIFLCVTQFKDIFMGWEKNGKYKNLYNLQ